MTHLTTQQWLEQLGAADNGTHECLRQLLGDRPEFIAHQRRRYAQLIQAYAQQHGPGPVWIVRAPGRVNLIGMHVDHRGGHVNPIAVQEMTFAVGARNDDQVHYSNLNPRFSDGCFTVGEEVPAAAVSDWTSWTQMQSDARTADGTAGDWVNYIKAPIVYLQDQLRDSQGRFSPQLRGMNLVADGSVPIAAGLSSSSSVVVAAMEAILTVNGLTRTPQEIVDLCGTAEWYIGTRGGKGDHAAIKLGRQGYLSHIGFFPLSVDYAPFPADYRVVVCNSHVEAKKSTGAKDIFNQRVASYEIALMLLKAQYPQLNEGVERFRDLLNPDRCHVTPVDAVSHEIFLYGLLADLPLRMTRSQVESALPASDQDALHRFYQTHSEPKEGYHVRGVALFGLGECSRSKRATEMLEKEDLAGFGRLMSLSHDGDRLSVSQGGGRVPFNVDISGPAIAKLRESLTGTCACQQESARIAYQPGAYAVSCNELDTLVDAALGVEGVLGAGRIGAGLGGCISVLVHAQQVDALNQALVEQYYEPQGLPPAVQEFFPVAGSGTIDLDA